MGIIESATLGPVGQGGNAVVSSIWGQQFLGWRFHLPTASRITKVGGHLRAGSPDYPDLTLFAAVVKLPAANALPTFAPHAIDSTPDTVAHTLFVAQWPSHDLLVPLATPVALEPGHYALIFGGADGAVNYFPFAANGMGEMPVNNPDLPGASYFFGDAYRWISLNGPQKQRFVIAIIEDSRDQSPPSAPTGLKIQ